MTAKKYQVFVSSTYLDLLEERQEVMYALLELNCIPSGMELFPAANEDQWTLIQRVIDECDYYVVIIGGRYGSIGREGKSYTQMEYEYAVLRNKPVVAFLHRDPSSLPDSKREPKAEAQRRLADFRELAEARLCRYWTSPARLKADVISSLVQLIQNHPSPGWIRGGDAGIDYDELSELERQMRGQRIYGRTSLLKIVQSVVEKADESAWQSWSSEELMESVDREYEREPTNLVYWWLIIYGVLRFKRLAPWFDDGGQSWRMSVKYSEVAPRGRMLLRKLQRRKPSRDRRRAK